MGEPDPENPLFLEFSVLRGGSRPWSQTMVSEGARPWGRGRSGDCDYQEDAQYLAKAVLGKCPLHFFLFNGIVCSNTLFSNASALTVSLPVLSNSTCRGSRPPLFVEHIWVPILGASCSNKLFVGTLRPSHLCLGQEAIVSPKLSRDPMTVLLDFRAYNHGLKGPYKPNHIAMIADLRSYLSPHILAVRSGP